MTRLLTTCLLLAAATATAATPRVQALGGDGTYLEDAGNVLRWSGSLADHANRLILASGTFDGHGYPHAGKSLSGPWVGAQYAFGGEERPVSAALYLMSVAADQGGGNIVDLHEGGYHAVVCLNDWKTGSLAFSWRETSSADERLTGKRQEYGAGLRSPLDATSYMDWGLEVIRTYPAAPTNDVNPELREPTIGYALRWRLFAGLSRSLALVLAAGADSDGRELENHTELPDRHWRVGGALTWLPDPDRMVVGSVDYHRFGVPHEWWSGALLLRLAIEARLNAFLSARAAVGWEEREAPDESVAPVSMGLAVHLADWDLDLALATVPPLDTAGRRPGWGDPALGWLSVALARSF